MSNEDKDQGSELFDTDSEESSLTSETTDEEEEDQGETESSEDSESEGSEETLDLEGKTSAEEEREKQISAWEKKIKSGKATVDSLPKHQKWLKPHLEKRLGSAPAKVNEKDLDQLLDEKIALREQEQKFQELKDSINQTALSGAQKADLESEYKDLREMGIDKATALEKALKIAKIEVASNRRGDMIPPRPSTVSNRNDVNEDNWREKLSEQERLAKLIEKTDRSRHVAKKFQ